MNRRLAEFGTSIFAEMSGLAIETGAINLGQGFPDTDGPGEIIEAAVAAMHDGQNQYPHPSGVPQLREAIAAHQKRFRGLDFDPATEVLVTTGATEALAAAMMGLCNPGDEVVTFEPYFDSYAAVIALAGAERRVVALRTPDFAFDREAFVAAISPKTRLVLLNTPHNPTGKVFTHEEMTFVAQQCVEHDLIAVTDEVYEHLVFDGEHRSLATYPGMADRTVTISSGGKTFSFTGWKVGWACARPELLAGLRGVKQFLTFASGGPFQHGIAAGLTMDDAYFEAFVADFRAKRDRLAAGLEAIGHRVFTPAGTYFIVTDISGLTDQSALEFCRELPARRGVVAIPSSTFYDDPDEGRQLVRWAFCKRDEVLDEAVARLAGEG